MVRITSRKKLDSAWRLLNGMGLEKLRARTEKLTITTDTRETLQSTENIVN